MLSIQFDKFIEYLSLSLSTSYNYMKIRDIGMKGKIIKLPE